jgi:Dynamin family
MTGNGAVVRQLLDQVHRTVELNLPELRRRDPAAAHGIEVLRRAVDQPPAVVVVGEQKRGKSSLINALLGEAGLSPVDIDVATSAYIVFRHGDKPRAVAHFPDAPPVEIDVTDLRDWGTALGDLPADLDRPRWIEVFHPAPMLAEVVLVDTPGVGGLDPAHAEAAMEAVGLAATLLFVVDAAAPLMDPEREFLLRATRAVRLVVFVMTKQDKYAGWRQLLGENQANLAAHVPAMAQAPWFTVSSRLALARTPEIMTQSGIGDLRTALAAVAQNGRLLRQINVLHAVRGEFDRLRADAQQLAAAVDPDPAERLRVEQELAAADARAKQADQDVNLRLNREFSIAQAAATHEVTVRLRAIDTELSEVIATANTETIKSVPDQFEAMVRRMLAQLATDVSEQFQNVTRRALLDLVPADELDEIAGRTQVELTELRMDRAMRTDNVDSTFNLITSLGAFGAVSSVAHVLTGGLTLIPMALGIGAMTFVARSRREAADRASAQRWLSQAVADVGRDTTANLSLQFADLRHALQSAIAEVGRRRRADLADRVREMRQAELLGRSERAERKKTLLADQQALTSRVRQLGELLATAVAAVPVPSAKGTS